MVDFDLPEKLLLTKFFATSSLDAVDCVLGLEIFLLFGISYFSL